MSTWRRGCSGWPAARATCWTRTWRRGETTGAVAVRGHAVEARVYAEDPSRDYRPSTGTLIAVDFPGDPTTSRVDTWVEAGTEVSASYDPLLAKVITVGADRDEAFDRLGRALDATVLHGIEVNVGMLRAALDTRRRAGGAAQHRRPSPASSIRARGSPSSGPVC